VTAWRARAFAAAAALDVTAPASAHDGPPYPIVSNKITNAYHVSVWTDPDTTDDETLGGQFWIIVHPVPAQALPPGTTVSVAVRAHGLQASERTAVAAAAADSRQPSRHFAAVRLDHEGMWDVRATIDGPLGHATVSAPVEATYDLRPAPLLLVVYLVPFLLVGLLWLKALRRGRRRPEKS
jgi:hypothetical protein